MSPGRIFPYRPIGPRAYGPGPGPMPWALYVPVALSGLWAVCHALHAPKLGQKVHPTTGQKVTKHNLGPRLFFLL